MKVGGEGWSVGWVLHVDSKVFVGLGRPKAASHGLEQRRRCDQDMQPHTAHVHSTCRHSRTPTLTHTVTLSHTPTAFSDTPNTLTCTHPHTNPRQQMGRSGNWLNLFPMSGSALAAQSDRKAGWVCTTQPAGPPPLPTTASLEQGSKRGLAPYWTEHGSLLDRA
jgi:hypothetical protein